MTVLNYSTLVNNPVSFTPGQDTKIFISTAYNRGDTVPTQSFTLGSVSAVGSGATATVTVSGGAVTAIQITAGGSGYINGAVIAFTGTGGSGASATLTVANGVVTGYSNLIGGSGYPTSGTTAAITGFAGSGSVSVGDVEIGLTAATSVNLYEGTRLAFNDGGVIKPVYVSAYTPAGAKGIPIIPSAYGIASGAIAVISAWVPLFSANQINLDDSATVIAEQNFSAGLNVQKAVTQLDAKSNTQGIQVYADPGLVILQAAKQLAQLVNVSVLKGGQRGGRDFVAVIAGLPESIQKNQYIQQTCNLEVSGNITYYTY